MLCCSAGAEITFAKRTTKNTPKGINAIRSIQDICFYLGSDFAGALYACANDDGEAAKNPALLEKAKEYGAAL